MNPNIKSYMQIVLGDPCERILWHHSHKVVPALRLRTVVLKTHQCRKFITNTMLLPPFLFFYRPLTTFYFSLYFLIFLLYLFGFVWIYTCHSTQVEVRGQLSGISSLPLPICSSWEWTQVIRLGGQVSIPVTCEPAHQPFTVHFFPW